MARATASLAFLYSGGPTNVNPALSFGGQASTVSGRLVHSQTYTASSIPGVTIEHAARNPAGTGYLSYTASNTSLTWLNPLGASSTVVLTGSGVYSIGTTDGGYLRVVVAAGSLPGADTGQNVTVADALSTLFDLPAANELTSGVTDYRAMYLHNRSSGALLDVVLTLTDNAPASTLSIGSTFNPLSSYDSSRAEVLDLSFFNPMQCVAAYTTSTSALIPRERLGVLTPRGLPTFPFFPTDVTQNSDGATVDVELLLTDDIDSTQKLSAVAWSTTLQWSTIPAGKMVSLWVRRVLPPNPTVPVTEQAKFDITFTQS